MNEFSIVLSAFVSAEAEAVYTRAATAAAPLTRV